MATSFKQKNHINQFLDTYPIPYLTTIPGAVSLWIQIQQIERIIGDQHGTTIVVRDLVTKAEVLRQQFEILVPEEKKRTHKVTRDWNRELPKLLDAHGVPDDEPTPEVVKAEIVEDTTPPTEPEVLQNVKMQYPSGEPVAAWPLATELPSQSIEIPETPSIQEDTMPAITIAITLTDEQVGQIITAMQPPSHSKPPPAEPKKKKPPLHFSPPEPGPDVSPVPKKRTNYDWPKGSCMCGCGSATNVQITRKGKMQTKFFLKGHWKRAVGLAKRISEGEYRNRMDELPDRMKLFLCNYEKTWELVQNILEAPTLVKGEYPRFQEDLE